MMAALPQLYCAHGVRFRYPEEWEVSEQREEGQLSITVSSPHTSFWTLTLFSGRPEPDDIVTAVLEAFYEEYEELDDYRAKARLCRRPTVARDIDFVCHDLLNTARLRVFQTSHATVMVLYQGTDAEFERSGPLCEQMTKSLAVTDNGDTGDDGGDDPAD